MKTEQKRNRTLALGLIILVFVFLSIGSITTIGNQINARLVNVTTQTGLVIGSFADGVSCGSYTYCIYHPWYSPTSTYAKNGSTGAIEYIGTPTAVLQSVMIKDDGNVFVFPMWETLTDKVTFGNRTKLTGQSRDSVKFNASGAMTALMYMRQNRSVELKSISVDTMKIVNNPIDVYLSDSARITDVAIYNISSLGIQAQGSKNLTVRDSLFYGQGNPLLANGYGIWSDTTPSDYWYIVGNTFTDISYNVISTNANYSIITNNKFLNSGTYTGIGTGMIYLHSPGANFNTISNNIFNGGNPLNGGTPAIEYSGDGNTTITGNVINNMSYGILLGTSGATITGNMINVTYDALRVRTGASNFIFSNNYIIAPEACYFFDNTPTTDHYVVTSNVCKSPTEFTGRTGTNTNNISNMSIRYT